MDMAENQNKDPNLNDSRSSMLIALGAGFGVALGAGVGAALGDVAIGAGIGTALGAAIGTIMMVIRSGNVQ